MPAQGEWGRHHLAISRGGAQPIRTMRILILLAALARSDDSGGPGSHCASEHPDRVMVDSGQVRLTYQGRVLFEGRISTTGGPASLRQLDDSDGGRVTQVIKWTAAGDGRITLNGVVLGSPEAFAAEVEPREDGLRVVRHAVGPVANRLNRAFYDRRADWVLSVDEPARVELAPVAAGDSTVAYQVTAKGGEVSLRFRPRFYQRHRGLAQYRPWEYRPWTKSVAGWTSWYAFFDNVTERDIHQTADVMSDVLRPFGYTYLQIDDGYQQLPIGMPDHWLHTNDKFPGGLDGLVRYIGARGLAPGIWTNVSFQDRLAGRDAPAVVRENRGREAGEGELGGVRPGRELGGRHGLGGDAGLPRASGDGLGLLQARRAPSPPVRGLQQPRRLLRAEGAGSRGGVPERRQPRARRDRA